MPSLITNAWRALKGLDDLEVVVFAGLAGVCLLAWRLLAAGHYTEAVAVAMLWVTSGIALIRDIRRRRFTWISGLLCLLWLAGTFIIGLAVS